MSTEQTEETTESIYAPVVDTPTNYIREPVGTHPPLDYPPYKSTALRHPTQPLIYLPQTISEVTAPPRGEPLAIVPGDADLTRQHEGEPIGERITVSGRGLGTEGKPLPNPRVEGGPA